MNGFPAPVKQLLIRLMLVVYAFGVLKPLSPIITDVLAHTFWKMQHLATVHYEHGRYHVHTELAEAARKDPAQKNPATASAGVFIEAHLVNAAFTLRLPAAAQPHCFIPARSALPEAPRSMTTPPPEA